MILGRTASNAIKIKTDIAGGGLRAVECACCCGCLTSIPSELLTIMRNATTGTCNGAAPVYWTSQDGGFYGIWNVNGNFYIAILEPNSNCFQMGGDNTLNLLFTGKCLQCSASWAMTCVDQQYTINGISFPCHTDITDNTFPDIVPPPSFVF